MIEFALALAVASSPPLLLNRSLFVPEDYPVRMEVEQEGLVRFTLEVGPDGRATACRIDTSSGVHKLDEATCSLAQRRAKFKPALDEDGQPTTGFWTSQVAWKLPIEPDPANWRVTFQGDGGMTTCLATKGDLQKKVRQEICQKMVSSYLGTHAQLPDHVLSPLTAEMLEPVQ